MFLLQADVAFWAAFINNPIALLMVIIGSIIVIFVKVYLPKYITKKAEVQIKKIESDEKIAIEENNRLIKNMGDIAGRIEANVFELNKKYEDLSKTIQGQSRSVERTSRQVDLLIVYNESQETIDRLIAFNWCLKAGKNGKLFEYGCKLILSNKQIWQWVLEHDLYKQPDNQKYQALLAKISDSILKF
jgi:Txe/YoeB family toxin of Txe-Axe toxin-antitoxin module